MLRQLDGLVFLQGTEPHPGPTKTRPSRVDLKIYELIRTSAYFAIMCHLHMSIIQKYKNASTPPDRRCE